MGKYTYRLERCEKGYGRLHHRWLLLIDKGENKDLGLVTWYHTTTKVGALIRARLYNATHDSETEQQP